MNPDVFGLQLSLSLIIGVVIGGVGFEFGPVLGAPSVLWLPYLSERVSSIHPGSFLLPAKPDLYFGILLVVVIFFAPSGAMGLIMRGIGLYRARRAAARGEAVPIAPPTVLEEEPVGEEPSEISN